MISNDVLRTDVDKWYFSLKNFSCYALLHVHFFIIFHAFVNLKETEGSILTCKCLKTDSEFNWNMCGFNSQIQIIPLWICRMNNFFMLVKNGNNRKIKSMKFVVYALIIFGSTLLILENKFFTGTPTNFCVLWSLNMLC